MNEGGGLQFQLVIRPTATITEGAIDVTVLPIVGGPGRADRLWRPGRPRRLERAARDVHRHQRRRRPGELQRDRRLGRLDHSRHHAEHPRHGTLTILALGGGQFGVYGVHTYASDGHLPDHGDGQRHRPGDGRRRQHRVRPALVDHRRSRLSPVPGPGPGVLAPGIEGTRCRRHPAPAGTAGRPSWRRSSSTARTSRSATTARQIDWGDGSPQSAGQVTFDRGRDRGRPQWL